MSNVTVYSMALWDSADEVDDAPETVRERLRVYHEKTAPLIAYYENEGILVTVEGREDPDETSKAVFEALE